MKNLKLFSVGQFAKMHNINKRTLHYYDEIDLLKPAHIEENGYRYYSYYQSVELELILVMRRLGLSIDEILQYKQDRSLDKLVELFSGQVEMLKKDIIRLSNTQSYIEGKLEQLKNIQNIKEDIIEIVELEEEKLILSEKYRDDSNEEYFRLMRSFNTIVKKEEDIGYKFGSRIAVENIYNNKLLSYDRFFMTAKKDKTAITQENLELSFRPAGKYIRVYTKGNWYKIMDIYKKIVEFCNKNGYTLEGYGYEVGVNELNSFTVDDYITEITVKIKDNK